MFSCCVCGKLCRETERVYENNDWCPRCIKKEGNRFTSKHSTPLPCLYSDIPNYIKYPKVVPDNIKKIVRTWK